MTAFAPATRSPIPCAWCSARGWLSIASALVAVRLLCANYRRFWEGDDFSIAAGVIALLRDNHGDVYRYVPQWGYYRLVQLLDVLLGSDPTIIPLIMIVLSAIAGGLIPALALLAFRSELRFEERILLALALFINPILWISSSYGNTAIVSLAFVVAGVTIASNRSARRFEILALALLGLGILIRADAILVTPLIVLLLFDHRRSLSSFLVTVVSWGVVMACVYGLIALRDHRAQAFLAPVAEHLFNPAFRTQFWEYLIWAFSPFPLLLALWGVRDLMLQKRRLLKYMAVWCLPVFAFYFSSTTTPRYFLLTIVPVSVCGVIGLMNLAAELTRKTSPRAVWAMLLTVSSLHLFVALGHFTPDRFTNLFRGAGFMTHDGTMFSGGFLLRSGSTLLQTLRNPGFDAGDEFVTDLQALFGDMTSRRTSPRTVIVLLAGWNGGRFHYQAQIAGAKYVSRKPGKIFATETWLRMGNTRIMTIANWGGDYDALDRFEVTAGDEIWTIGARPGDPPLAAGEGGFEETMGSKFPPGLTTIRITDPARGIHAFRLIETTPQHSLSALPGALTDPVSAPRGVNAGGAPRVPDPSRAATLEAVR